jgi:hypothetical protein
VAREPPPEVLPLAGEVRELAYLLTADGVPLPFSLIPPISLLPVCDQKIAA